jgi:hypothetical protein
MRTRVAEPLAERTTLRLGGPAATLVEVDTEAELVETVDSADRDGRPLLVLGGGSNLVVADEGFDGTVVAIGTRGVEVDSDAHIGALTDRDEPLRLGGGDGVDDSFTGAIDEARVSTVARGAAWIAAHWAALEGRLLEIGVVQQR